MSHQVVADVLLETLTNAGWIDDADELIADLLLHLGFEKATERVREIQIAMEFVKDNETHRVLRRDDRSMNSGYGDLDRLPELLEEAIDNF